MAETITISIAPGVIDAMKAGQRVLAMFIDPVAIEKTTTLHAYTQAVEAEAKLRAALRNLGEQIEEPRP